MKLIVSFFLSIFLVAPAVAMKIEKFYPRSVNRLFIDTAKTVEYKKLSKKIGLQFDKRYSYTQFYDLCQANKIGVAGQYEFLLYSVGKPFEEDTSSRLKGASSHWESTYYKNHDVTMIHEVSNDADGLHSWVRVVKIAPGKRPNLNIE